MIPADIGERGHVWRSTGDTSATCEHCGADARVVLRVGDAGMKAGIERHGPTKCPRREWWKVRDPWSVRPRAPWEPEDTPRAPGARGRSTGQGRQASPRKGGA